MPDNETLSAAAFFLVALLAAAWGYLKKPPTPAAPAATGTVISAAIGMGWLEKDQAERLLSYVERTAKAQERIAIATEALADKRSNEMKDAIEELMDVMREKERRIRDLEGMRVRRRRSEG